MGATVFDNYVFDSWLNKKSDEILSKVDKSTISTEEMLTLILKAQTNHFHHMDVEFRDEFKKIDDRFEALQRQMDSRFEKSDTRLESLQRTMDDRFKWQIGVLITLFAGIYLKLFLG